MSDAPVAVDGSTFVIVSNGFADGPAEALRPFLLERGAARVVDVSHPLTAEGPTGHRIVTYEASGASRTRTIDPRLGPPWSFALDPLLPPRLGRSDGWFGFNCLATGRGLLERRLGRTRRVVHWSVDFVPDRFGPGVLTRAYDSIDALCCRRADARVDLSAAALDARAAAHGLGVDAAPGTVIPMGCWLERTPRVDDAAFDARRVVFLGHLVERMGVDTLLDAVTTLREAGDTVTVEVMGGGPLLDTVRRRAGALGVTAEGGPVVTVHGFVEDHRDVEAILARATVAAAPYSEDPSSFTRWADPGKLKAYLGAGLPIVMTSTPPTAAELAEAGAALVVSDDAADLAAGLVKVLDDRERWRSMHRAASAEARRFDWPVVLETGLRAVGFTC
ncbi:MAG: glycosyltransferase [Microthrixaceae bacterium]